MTLTTITPNLEDTGKLLEAVLTLILPGNRVRFFVAPGTGAAVVQRLRVKLSRTRKGVRRKGARHIHFVMKSEVFPWTLLDGTRQDCVILWRHTTRTHRITEKLEGLLHGQSI